MKHIAAYALLVLAGKDAPTAAEIEKVLKEAGATSDSDKVASLVAALAGKSFDQFVAEGIKAMGSMGGSAPAASSGAAAAEKKAEVVEEEPEEDVDMGDLFGGDY